MPRTSTVRLSSTTSFAQATVWRGHRLDETGLYYLGARYYDSQGGRFLSSDPLGHAARMDLYSYANGDPIRFAGPDGRVASQGSLCARICARMTAFLIAIRGSS